MLKATLKRETLYTQHNTLATSIYVHTFPPLIIFFAAFSFYHATRISPKTRVHVYAQTYTHTHIERKKNADDERTKRTVGQASSSGVWLTIPPSANEIAMAICGSI